MCNHANDIINRAIIFIILQEVKHMAGVFHV